MNKNTLLIFLILSFSTSLFADPSFKINVINLKTAQNLNMEVLKIAKERNLKLATVVFDSSGHLVHFSRMDGVKPIIIKVALGKAYTSAITQNTTANVQKKAQPGGPAYGGVTNLQGIMTIQGGVPIMFKGDCIGAIGVSGTSAKEDEEIALLAINNVLSKLNKNEL